MSLFPSHLNMDYSIYRMFGQRQNTERSMMQKPKKHPYHCQHKWACKDYPKCPKWHRTVLRLSSIVLVILTATVTGLTIWVSHLSSEHGIKDCDCMNISPRKQQDNTNFTTKPRLNLCPNNWLQKKGKCYNFLKSFKSWTDSQKSCLIMKSHLLMIQDKAELDFIQSNIQDGIYFWIGLNITHPQKTWTWLDGTPLNPQLVQAEEAAATPEALLTKMSEVQETKPINSAYFKSLVDLKVREWGSTLYN
ncbi:killer cell lectin-like receptor subfamily F member 1 isoform X1 [Callorhinus ursinus]|uniref:Killer cell lectin-like receptor subfamily F member 1 isoform X1 n=2 Tax=Callorhinus ursinus TaxID=34884 RepID=A0A3Q7PPC9_CALUR|nr:killer cell lectin-like receptor subfamily F member 1 isoform X1 [Callorhinus ursinus]